MPSLKQLKHAIRNMAKIDVNSLSRIDGISNSLQAIERGQASIAGDLALVHGGVTELAQVAKAQELEREQEQPVASSVLDGKLIFEYTYTPAIRDLKSGAAGKRLMAILNEPTEKYRDLLAGINALSDWLEKIPTQGSPEDLEPYWENHWFEGLDAASLYYFLVKNNPAVYMEVGSGNSTKFARKAINDHGLKTKIISIDPQPRADIDQLCDQVIRQKCEDVDPSAFEALSPSDILFIDNGHRSFQGSDVTVFFTEILPSLPKGMLFGIHDIFLPFDYPTGWLDRFYNEQYLLMAYLHGGMGGGSVELPVRHVNTNGETTGALSPSLLEHMGLNGGAFWMRS